MFVAMPDGTRINTDQITYYDLLGTDEGPKLVIRFALPGAAGSPCQIFYNGEDAVTAHRALDLALFDQQFG